MNEKRIPLSDEAPKYKKKSNAKGLPRSKHKHIYETVLLKRYYNYNDFTTGRPKTEYTELPTKVCSICGRVDHVDTDSSFYTDREVKEGLPYRIFSKELSEKALNLPKWYIADFFDKFALEGDKPENV
jgi:hypothetical protein